MVRTLNITSMVFNKFYFISYIFKSLSLLAMKYLTKNFGLVNIPFSEFRVVSKKNTGFFIYFESFLFQTMKSLDFLEYETLT